MTALSMKGDPLGKITEGKAIKFADIKNLKDKKIKQKYALVFCQILILKNFPANRIGSNLAVVHDNIVHIKTDWKGHDDDKQTLTTLFNKILWEQITLKLNLPKYVSVGTQTD